MKSTGLVLGEKPSVGIEPTRLPDRSRFGNHGTYTNITDVQLPSGLWVRECNGTSSKVDVGDIANPVKSVGLWVYPDNHTRSIMDLDSGTHSIEIDASSDITATGWSSPTIYVNGAVAAAITLSKWNFVFVTTATAIDVSNLDIGTEATWYDGKFALSQMFSHVLSAGQTKKLFEAERHWFGA